MGLQHWSHGLALEPPSGVPVVAPGWYQCPRRDSDELQGQVSFPSILLSEGCAHSDMPLAEDSVFTKQLSFPALDCLHVIHKALGLLLSV